MIRTKRVYEPPSPDDGDRFLVDRIWPRGIKKIALEMKSWEREAAPSNDLRHWFGHDPTKWDEFKRRYFAELDANPGAWHPLLEAARNNDITLLHGAHDTEHNNALALREYLEKHL